MARGTNLTTLITMVRDEAGHSNSVAAGVNAEASIIRKIQSAQNLYWLDYDWPFLNEYFDITLQAGERYYDLPTKTLTDGSISVLDMERIEKVAINTNGRPIKLERGIGFDQYAQYNSDNDERASPCIRWDITRSSGPSEQIEVWPIPTDSTQIISFKGIRNLRPLIAGSDVADLDDELIALTVAAEFLDKAGAKNAKAVEGRAARIYAKLRGRMKGASRMRSMSAMPQSGYMSNRGKTIIRIGSQSN